MPLPQLLRQTWFARLAEKSRKPARPPQRAAFRRLGMETLERREMLAANAQVGGMTFSVIDDRDPGYTESAYATPRIVDNDSPSGFVKSVGIADMPIDNGHDAYYAELGAGWATSGLGGLFDGTSRYSSAADAKARYTFTGLLDGAYGVQVAVPGHSNSAQAKYTASSASGTTVIINSYNQQGAKGDFATIGSVIVTGGTLTIEVSRAGSGSLRTDAIRLQGIGWTESGLGGVGDQQTSLYAYAAGATATYSFSNLSSKTHEIRVNTPAHENSTSNAVYTVRSGGAIVGTFHLDQRPGTNGWKSLGFVEVPGGDLEITVSKTGASGVLRVDAIQVREATGWLESSLAGHDGGDGPDSRYTHHGTASYTFSDLSPGDLYQVYIKTPGHSNSTTNAVYEILSGDNVIQTITGINQTTPTSSQPGNIEGWLPIGTAFNASSGSIVVRATNTNGASGFLRADALAVGSFVNVTAYQATRISTAPANPLRENEEVYPRNLILPVNDDADEHPLTGQKDNADLVIGALDDDTVRLTLSAIRATEGTVNFQIVGPGGTQLSFVRLFDHLGNALPSLDFSIDLADIDQSSPLKGIATGDVTLFVEGLFPIGDMRAKLTYTDSEASWTDTIHMHVLGVDLDTDSLRRCL